MRAITRQQRFLDRYEVAMMILYPAIDLKDGACVRLRHGDMDTATVFGTDPAAMARRFADQGASWLHVVDLNGAFAGRSVNGAAVEAILDAAPECAIQLAGGIRTLEHIAAWIERGARRIVLGTVAIKDPAVVRDACREFPGHIAVAVDARDGRVAVEGWVEETDMQADALAKRFEDAGVAAIIHTDITRDGVLAGVNVAAGAALARNITIPVIASGGVAGLEDITNLAETGLFAGAVIGRALYDGRLDLPAALAVAGRGLGGHEGTEHRPC